MSILINNTPIKVLNFPAGESHISLPVKAIAENTTIQAWLPSANQIIELLLSVDALRRLRPSTKIDLTIIVDPHSEVTPALLDNCQVVTQADIIAHSELVNLIKQENWVLIAPDAGAEKKIYEVAKTIAEPDFSPEVLCGSKVRDTKTGKIIKTTFQGDVKRKKGSHY